MQTRKYDADAKADLHKKQYTPLPRGVGHNNQGFVYLEPVKYQLGLGRNMPVFVKCNVCISAIQ